MNRSAVSVVEMGADFRRLARNSIDERDIMTTNPSIRPKRGHARIAVPLAALAVSAAFASSAVTSAAPSTAYGDPETTVAATDAAAEGTAAEGSAAEGTAAEGSAVAVPVGGSSVGVAQSFVGPILVDANGMTLYMFTPDVDGESTCAGECAATWPAAIIEGDPDVGDLDSSLFSTVDSTDGATMLKVGDWPLYTFAGDAAPGDMNGQAVGGVWWVVTPQGNPIALASSAETSLGDVLVDASGMTLYMFQNDADGEATCVDDCATNWPPVLMPAPEEGTSTVPADSAASGEEPALFVGDLDPDLFSVVDHPLGPMLKFGDWPLYRFAGDSAPGDVNGQGVGDVWFAVSADGTPVSN